MHSAIITIVLPQNDLTGSFNDKKWNDFIADVDQMRKSKPDQLHNYKGVKRLAENVWQVNFLIHPEILARLVHYAGEHSLPCEILQLDAEPQWLPAGSGPKPR